MARRIARIRRAMNNAIIMLVGLLIGYLLYPASLATWAGGCYKPSIWYYRLLWWLVGHSISVCVKCGYEVRWDWEMCPMCGHRVADSLLVGVTEKEVEDNLS